MNNLLNCMYDHQIYKYKNAQNRKYVLLQYTSCE